MLADAIADGEEVPPPRSAETLRADPEVAQALADGAAAIVPLLLDAGRPGKANLSLDAGLLAFEASDDFLLLRSDDSRIGVVDEQRLDRWIELFFIRQRRPKSPLVQYARAGLPLAPRILNEKGRSLI